MLTIQDELIRRARARIEARYAANQRIEDPQRVKHLKTLMRSIKLKRKSLDRTLCVWRNKSKKKKRSAINRAF